MNPAIAPSIAPEMIRVSSSCSKIGCRTLSNSWGVISAILSRISSFRPNVSSVYSCSTCTWSINRSFTLLTTSSNIAVSSTPPASKPRPCDSASRRTKSLVNS